MFMVHLNVRSCPAEFRRFWLLCVCAFLQYDVLFISERGEHVISNGIGEYFKIEEDWIGLPSQFWVVRCSMHAWSFSS